MPCLIMNDIMNFMDTIRTILNFRGALLGSRMSPNRLIEFEKTHMIRFPGEYRLYLLNIADGIRDISGLQILPFEQTPAGYPLEFSQMVDNLKSVFPYEESIIFSDIKKLGLRHEGGYITLGPCFGSDKSYWVLICEGNQRGEIWIVNWSVGFFPCRMTFKEWLKDWVTNDGRALYDIFHKLPLEDALWMSVVEEDSDFPYRFSRRRRNAVELRGGLQNFHHVVGNQT